MKQSTLWERYEKWSSKNTPNKNYCLCISDVEDIANQCHSVWTIITRCFEIGYMQGMKATKAEMKKKAVVK